MCFLSSSFHFIVYLVVSCDVRDGSILSSQLILDAVYLVILTVDGSEIKQKKSDLYSLSFHLSNQNQRVFVDASRKWFARVVLVEQKCITRGKSNSCHVVTSAPKNL